MQADISTTQNPKDIIGATKPGLRHVPPGPLYLIGLALDDGARKYDAFNWRKSPIAASIYLDACKRHMDSFFHGAELAEDSGLPHLAHAAAGLVILLDAIQRGSMIDDRPHHNVPLDQILVDLAQFKKPVVGADESVPQYHSIHAAQ